MGDNFDTGTALKIAIPLAATAAAIFFTGGAAAPAAAPVIAGEAGAGTGSAALAGAGGLEGASAGLTEATGAGGLFAEPLVGIPSFTPAAPAGFNFGEGARNFALAAQGGAATKDLLGLNQPRTPFRMGAAQPPALPRPGGSFTPTSQAAMQELANRMAQSRQALGRVRFA